MMYFHSYKNPGLILDLVEGNNHDDNDIRNYNDSGCDDVGWYDNNDNSNNNNDNYNINNDHNNKE